MLSSEFLKHIGEQNKKIDAILDIIKNEPLGDKMTIISMVIDKTASTHNMRGLELWALMFDTAAEVYKKCGEIGGKND